MCGIWTLVDQLATKPTTNCYVTAANVRVLIYLFVCVCLVSSSIIDHTDRPNEGPEDFSWEIKSHHTTTISLTSCVYATMEVIIL